MAKGGGATCECGQVLFETASRKEGDKLTCPWCQRNYRFLGGEKIELIGTADELEAAEREKKEAKKEKKKADAGAQPHRGEKNDERREEKNPPRDKDKEKERAAPKRSPRVTERQEKVSERQLASGEKKKPAKPKEIPGGVMMMIVFIIGFNALAFLALSIVMPSDGKMRQPIWGGDPIPASKNWPLLAALVLGHVVGFVAWSWYVYQLMKLQQLEKQEQALERERAERK